jgi:GTPase
MLKGAYKSEHVTRANLLKCDLSGVSPDFYWWAIIQGDYGGGMSESILKSGYVAIIGRPNVGKSTLMNGFLKQKVAAVSPRPQTTRRRQLGILTLAETQMVFVDTPGIHTPRHHLGEYMNEEALAALADVDLILWMVDGSQPVEEEDRLVGKQIAALRNPPPLIQVLNKADLVPLDARITRQDAFRNILPDVQMKHIWISAFTQEGLNDLLQEAQKYIPEGEPFFDEDQVTDFYERDIAADLIREAALLILRDEVPHEIGVRLDDYKERTGDMVYIGATIFVNKESQKGIVIGKNGETLKRIGSAARAEIETMSGGRVYLELRVKVHKNWREDSNMLRLLGYYHRKEG